MKCLLYDWNSYFRQDLDELLQNENITIEKFSWKFKDYENDDEFLAWFDENIEQGVFDFVISVNYFPLISEASRLKGYKYIAWCYDCPLNVVNPELTMDNSNNYIFVFDKEQFNDYYNQGIETVYHLPLGVNSKRVRRTLNKGVKNPEYQCDVSLVGSLYESQLPIITQRVPEDVKKALNEIVRVQENLYDSYVIKQCITDGLILLINSCYEGMDFEVSSKALEFSLASEVTRNNRLVLLNLFGRRYDTRLYSFQSFQKLEGVKQCGVVDYVNELPYVIANSKINLNPVLRCIRSGIPLRAFDIMGYGGFLLSSYQAEIDSGFKDGEHLAMYKSYEEAVDKADYYLKNDDIRNKIALKGQEIVIKEHTLEDRFRDILKTSGIV